MSFETIHELNTHLSNNLTKLDIKEYIQKYHDTLHKDMDISFMDYFLYLSENQDKFIVEHNKLIEYGIFTSTRSNDIKDRIKSLDLMENEDYKVFAAERSAAKIETRGGSNKLEYIFTPEAFKICLIRSKNTKKYAKYYLFLEKSIHYYQKYQELYTQVLISGKDHKIDDLLKENKEQSKKMDEQSRKIDELLGYAKDTKMQNEVLIDEVDDLNNKVDDLDNKVEDLRETVKDRNEHFNVDPQDDTLIHMFALLQYKNEPNTLRIIRGQNKHISKNIKDEDYNILINKTYNPNPVDLFTLIKDKIKENDTNTKKDILSKYKNNLIDREEKKELLKKLKDNPPIKIRYNTIILNSNTSSDQLIDLVKECDKIRINLNIP